ncbi:MAG TPA: amidohydrolase family protein [Pirellulales bacterium]|jgi:predicted TIM-barrel fold metal-dependent hydrolase|nr:amidohydrolase family protein [Pirellulales bacterium]
MIVDTHVHVTSDDLKRYPRVKDAYDWPTHTVESLLAAMDEVGIDRALLVQPYFTYAFDNSYQADAALAHKNRFLCVCVIDQLANGAPDILSELVAKKGVAGIRFMHSKSVPGVLKDTRSIPTWERAQALGIPICVAARLDEIVHARGMIERFPNVKVALEHMWVENIGEPPYRHFQPMFEMVQYPNVYLKITPNNSYAAREGKATPQAFFRSLVEHFGAKRIMWGSNYPAHWDKYGTIKDRLPLMQRDLAFLSADEQRWIFGETALSVWPSLR